MQRVAALALVSVAVACDAAGAAKAPRPTFSLPFSIAQGPSGTLFVTDGQAVGGRVLRYEVGRRRLTVFARGFTTPAHLARHADGSLLVSDLENGRVVRIDRRGRKTVVARIPAPSGLALAGDTLYVSSLESTIERVDLRTRAVTRVAGDGTPESTGDGGPARDAHVESPHGLALDGVGNLYLGGEAIRRIDAATGVITTVARVEAFQLAVAADGTLYFSQGDPRFGGAIKRRAPDGSVSTVLSGRSFGPTDVLLASGGRALVFAQTQPVPAVRRLDLRTGRTTTVVRGSGP